LSNYWEKIMNWDKLLLIGRDRDSFKALVGRKIRERPSISSGAAGAAGPGEPPVAGDETARKVLDPVAVPSNLLMKRTITDELL
jgi:hypothetical protein